MLVTNNTIDFEDINNVAYASETEISEILD